MRTKYFYLFICLLILLFNTGYLSAKSTKGHKVFFKTKAHNAILLEANTGKILYNKRMNSRIYPASMTKLMSLYIIFDQLAQHKISLDAKVKVSRNAYIKGGGQTGSSTMFLSPGDVVTVENLIHGIATLSGNDATIAMAEYIAGSESQFASYMNLYAHKLGLKHSHFVNSTGWPNPNHYSTVKDIATIARRLILDFPQYYYFFNLHSFTYKGITQYNRNSLLFDKSINIDGLKTGHTHKSGYDLVFSGENQSGVRLIGVVTGLSSNSERTEAGKRLFHWGLFNLGYKNLYKKGDLITKITVWDGSPGNIPVYADRSINIIYNNNTNSIKNFSAKIIEPNVLLPNVYKGQKVAKIIITDKKDPDDVQSYDLYASRGSKKSGFMSRFFHVPYYLLLKLFGSV